MPSNTTAGEFAIQTDRPIQSGDEDLFDRRGFAERIADVIASRSDPSSLVIGIYGPWGDGKTSTLNMIRARLSKREDIVEVAYNPWQFSADRDSIARSFWHTLVAAIGAVIVDAEKAKELISSLVRFVPVYGGDMADAIDTAFARGLDEVRRDVSEKLEAAKKRVVVFIDDIDRLERSEIQALFRLVKLSGDFPYVTYVLAFDDELVSAALGEAYGEGDAASGRRFLEKIVQVPLHLPPADRNALKTMIFGSCERVLADAGIVLTSEEGSRVASAFATTLLGLVKTPRTAKLIDNAMTFAVPVLKGEVHAGDQILIEAVRILLPRLHAFIRDNPGMFLTGGGGGYIPRGSDRTREDRERRLRQLLEEAGLSDRDVEMFQAHLLNVLFPRLSGSGYGEGWNASWSRAQRICSPDHFRRYFTYAVPRGDFADAEIEAIVGRAAAGEDVAETLLQAISGGAAEILIRKLRHREADLPMTAASPIIRGMIKAAAEIPVTSDIFLGDFEITQSAILVSRLLARLAPADRDEVLTVVAEGPSLLFAVQVFHHSVSDRHEPGWLTPAQHATALAIVLERVVVAARERRLGEVASSRLGLILGHLRRNLDPGSIDVLRKDLTAWAAVDASAPAVLLRSHSSTTSHGPGDFSSDGYEALKAVVDTDVLLAKLREMHGPGIEVDEYPSRLDDVDPDADRRLAMQFAWLHRRGEPSPDHANLEEGPT